MSCTGCTRRAVLRGLGAVAVIGCGTDPQPMPLDALMGVPCGTNQICLDLTTPPYTSLIEVGRILRIQIGTDFAIVIRATATEVVTLSEICTHQGCVVGYNANIMLVVCPCHGSQYQLTGAVAHGPATRALRSYPTTFDTTMQLVTITTA